MKRSIGIHLLIFILIVSTPVVSTASEECDTPRVMTSPCSGILLPTNAAEDSLRCIRVDAPKLRLELLHQKGLSKSQKNYYELILAAERKRSEDLSTQVNVLIKRHAPDKPMFENTSFWIFMGMFVGTAATIAIVYSLPRG